MSEPTKPKVLIVDDSELNRSLLIDMLGGRYDVLEAQDGEAALEILWQKGHELALMLLDIVMPGVDGFEVLEEMNRNDWMIASIPVIVISAETGIETLTRCFELGVVDFISRPFNFLIVQNRVENAIMLYVKQKKLSEIVEQEIYENEKRSSLLIMVLSHIVEFRNRESGLHVMNINMVTRTLLKQLRKKTNRYHLSDNDVTVIAMASSLHDIGKITISEEILNKPGRLTPEEFEIMKTHSMAGAAMLQDIPLGQDDILMKTAYQICRWHHERYDGRGYPDGLKGDAIPIADQIVGLADVYDALTSERVYKPAFDHDSAIRMILDGECGVFNPLLLECLKDVEKELEERLAEDLISNRIKDDVQRVASERYGSLDSTSSMRTLKLLEYERNKAQFYASISQDVLFDYSVNPDLLTISGHGMKKFGLPEAIYYPGRNEELLNVISREDMEKFLTRIRSLPRESMRLRMEVQLNVKGRKEWNRIVAQPIWSNDGQKVFKGAIGVISNIHRDYIHLLKLEKQVRHDDMTGLYNRKYAKQQIQQILRTSKSNCALLLLDSDNLKSVNDTQGHEEGDRYILQAAERIRASVRKGDVTARIGGDEFMVFLRYEDEIEKTVDRIFRSIVEGDNSLSMSMGVATTEHDGKTFRDLFHRADAALYAAKQAGRGQYRFYDDSMHDILSPDAEDVSLDWRTY